LDNSKNQGDGSCEFIHMFFKKYMNNQDDDSYIINYGENQKRKQSGD